MSGLGCSQCTLGGSTLSRSAKAAFSIPAAPAAPLRWPMFDLTEPSATDAPGQGRKLAEHVGHALHFHHVAHPGRGAVTLDQGYGRRRQAGILPSALDGELLADWVGRGDALALAVARAADAAQHGVDFVPVAFGVGQALEQEDRGAFTHDEAVGALRKGPRAGGRERTDLAELHEGRRTHVAVDAAGDRHVEIVRAPVLRPPR